MAHMEIDFPEDLLGGLLDTDTEELCKQMVDAASPILEESMKREIKSVLSHDGSSELVNSVKAGKAKMSKNNAVIANVGPRGNSSHHYYAGKKKNRKYQVSNALKAIWLNYGRTGQPARPFLTKATNNAENAVVAKMQEIYEKKIGGKTDGRE